MNLLPESAKELFRRDEKHRTPAEVALKWLYDQPEVTCVLSGMNSMEMVEQNVKTASESLVGCLTESDQELIEKVKAEIKKNVKVGCTGCGYCMPCPAGIEINNCARMSLMLRRAPSDAQLTPEMQEKMKKIENCLHCNKCKSKCPYGLDTPALLQKNYEDYKRVLAGEVSVR